MLLNVAAADPSEICGVGAQIYGWGWGRIEFDLGYKNCGPLSEVGQLIDQRRDLRGRKFRLAGSEIGVVF